ANLVACSNAMTEPSIGGGAPGIYPFICGGGKPAGHDPPEQWCPAGAPPPPQKNCKFPPRKYCENAQTSASDYSKPASCTANGGEILTGCPTTGLVGCCTIKSPLLVSEQCIYTGADPTKVPTQQECTSIGGVWSTKP